MDATNSKCFTILSALQSGKFEEARYIAEQQETGDEKIISNALVQATYLLSIKSQTTNITVARKQEICHLKGIIKSLLECHKANPTHGLLTAFHHCMRLGEFDIMKLFILNGVDPNERDCQGNTALHLACLHTYNPDIVRYLVTFGRQAQNIVNSAGECPLLLAVEKLCGSANHDLSHQTDSIMESIIMLLNCKDIDVNLQDNEGRSPLFCIFEKLHAYHNTEYMRKLYKISDKIIKAGADLNLANKKGQRLIHLALEHFWINNIMICDFVNLLLSQNGIDVNVSYTKNCEQMTPLLLLFYNLENMQKGMVFTLMSSLLQKGADPKALFEIDNDGGNILHIVTRFIPLHTECLSSLLSDPERVSPDFVNKQDHKGHTPFSYLYCRSLLPEHSERVVLTDQLEVRESIREREFKHKSLAVSFNSVQQLIMCGYHLTQVLEHVFPLLYSDVSITSTFDELHVVRHLLLFLRAGFSLQCLTQNAKFKLMNYFVYTATVANNDKFIECLISDFNFHFSDKWYQAYSGESLKKLTGAIGHVQNEPVSLQRQCARVIRYNLFPNALYGVAKLKCRQELPCTLRDIVLADDLDRELYFVTKKCVEDASNNKRDFQQRFHLLSLLEPDVNDF